LSVPNVARWDALRTRSTPDTAEQLDLPGFYWHSLQGVDRWTVRVTGNGASPLLDWRDAVAVDLEDYH